MYHLSLLAYAIWLLALIIVLLTASRSLGLEVIVDDVPLPIIFLHVRFLAGTVSRHLTKDLVGLRRVVFDILAYLDTELGTLSLHPGLLTLILVTAVVNLYGFTIVLVMLS